MTFGGDKMTASQRCNLLQIFDNLIHVDFSDCHYFICDIFVAYMAQRFPNLKSLYLSGCDNLTDEGILFAITKCPHLERLDISYCRKISDICLSALTVYCRKIQYVNLVGCKLVTAATFEQFLGAFGGQLTGFCPNKSANVPELIERLATICPNITKVDLTDLSMQNALKVLEIAKFHQLLITVKLTIPSEVSQTAPFAKAFSNMSQLTKLVMVTEMFYLKGCVAPLISAGSLSQTLRHVEFSNGGGVDDEDTMAIVTHCHNLRTLQLHSGYAGYMQDSTMRIVMDNCPDLEMFRAGKTPEVKEETLLLLAEKCPNLQMVYCMRDGDRMGEINKKLDAELSGLMFFSEYDVA